MGTMNCERVLDQCKAECCGSCPFPLALWERNQKNIQRPPVKALLDDQGYVHAVAAECRCVFLREDFRCAIYYDRPSVCHRFGDESDLMLTCRWQAADGRIRDRVERKQLSRKLHRGIQAIIDKARAVAARDPSKRRLRRP